MPTRFSPQYREAFIEELAKTVDALPHAVADQPGLSFEQHQREVNRNMLNEIKHNRAAALCAVACCGSGKTAVEVNLVAASQRAKRRLGINGERRDIVIAPERMIIHGIREEFERFGYKTGILIGGEQDLDKPVIVATVQALQWRLSHERLYDLLPPGTVDLAIFDEADLYLTSSRNEDLIPALDPRIRIGLTATPQWPDGRHITDAFGRQVSELRLREGVLNGINAEPDFYLFEAGFDESTLRIRKSDYDPAVLAMAMKHAEIHKAIPEIYRTLVPENRQHDWPTLVYVPSVKLAHRVADTLSEEFPELFSMALTGRGTTTEQVRQIRELFKAGDINILVLCEMGARGMNLENATVLIDGYPTLSLNKLEQRHGRVLRKIRPGSALWNEGKRKEQAIIAQLIPQSNRFRRPALFTDIIRQEEIIQLRLRRRSRGGEGPPVEDIIDQVRRHIESRRPTHYIHMVEHIRIIEEIARIDELPQADESGFFYLPQRYARRTEPSAGGRS